MSIFNTKTEEEIEKPEEKWVWVRGYKGVNADMSANHGDIIYELNKEYTEEKAELCESGFHLCLSLSDVWCYRSIATRVFEVEALVREEDRDNYGKTKYISYHGLSEITNKIVAKKIIFRKELDFETIKKYKGFTNLNIETEEQYKELLELFPKEEKYSSNIWRKYLLKKDLNEMNMPEPIFNYVYTVAINKMITTDSKIYKNNYSLFMAFLRMVTEITDSPEKQMHLIMEYIYNNKF